MELLGDIGGLQQALYMIGLLFVGFFARRLFVSAILKEIYQTKYDRGMGHKGPPKKSYSQDEE
jgi:hypothetical protein